MSKTILAVVALCMSTAVLAADTDAYIESDGSAGIDTGYRLKSVSRVELDFALVDISDVSKAPRVFGADKSHSELKLSGSLYVDSGSYWRIHIGNGTGNKEHYLKFKYSGESSETLHTCDTERHCLVIDYPARKFSMNVDSLVVTNAFVSDVYPVEGSESTQTLALFARQLLNGGFEKPSKSRIYGMKIYEDNVLVRDFVPCVKDGVKGFKDLLSGNIVCNPEAEGAFTVGGDVLVEESTYVATPADNNVDSDKKLYIDTGYYATENTSMELDYALVEAYPSNVNPTWYLFSGESRFCSYINKNGIGFGVSSVWSSKTLAGSLAGVPGVRRTVVLNVPDKFCAVITAGHTNEVLTIDNTGAYSENHTIKIGAYASAANYFASMKVYGCRIYESGKMVRNFHPVVIGPNQDSSVIIGMKDIITGAFITFPAATASRRLLCGSTAPVVSSPYVEICRSDCNYIDMGYLVNSATKVELDYAPAQSRESGDTWYLFWAKDTGVYAAYVNDKGFGFINTKDSWEQSVGASYWPDNIGVRRTVILDNPSSLASVAIDGQICASRSMTGPAEWSFNRLSLKIGGAVNNASSYASMRIYGCKIWEKHNDEYVLKHHFQPYVKESVAGLMDVVSGTFKTCNKVTYGGAFIPTVSSSTTKLGVGKSAVLMATAQGATSYRWLMNGQPIEGGEDGSLEVQWSKGGDIDSYQSISIYSVDSLKVESSPSQVVTVENLRAGTIVSVR